MRWARSAAMLMGALLTLVAGSGQAEQVVAQYEKVEITVDAPRHYANPFDPAEVEVTGEFTTPSGRRVRVPGFYYQGYVRSQNGEGEEVLTAAGAGVFKVRFAWGEVGDYRYRVRLRDRAGLRQVAAGTFQVSRGRGKGYVRRSSAPRYLEYDSGAACFPIGENLQEPRAGGSYDYDRWVGALADHGANYFRVMLNIIVNREDRLALEHLPDQPNDGTGLGRYDQQAAWRIDHILEVSEARGVLAQMCLDSSDEVQEKSEWAPFASWHTNPYNAANGGPAARPIDFFRNAEAKRRYHQRLRYVVARWGYSPAVLAWELWNEWDQTTGYDSAVMAGWHAEMTGYVRGIDPWRHLVTTSCGNTAGDPETDRLAEMDYVQSHEYGAPDVAGSVAATCLAKTRDYGKPHLFAECGADTSGHLDSDPVILGSVLHDGLWAATHAGGAGTAMTWFWESVERNNLYGAYAAIAAYTAGVEWVRENYRPAAAQVRFAQGRPAGYGTLSVIGAADPWSPQSAASRPQRFRIGREGAIPKQEALSRVLHGVRNHADLHNPITFEVDYPAAGQFIIDVERVAPEGATLVVTLDGKPALSQDFPRVPPEERGRGAGEEGRSYTVEVAAGAHTITVENTGVDWLYAGYRLTNYLAAPNVRALAMVGRDSALVWVQNREHTWGRIRQGSVTPAPAAEVSIGGFRPGEYEVEQWDTYAGQATSTTQYQSKDGRVVITTPAELVSDVAYRVRRAR